MSLNFTIGFLWVYFCSFRVSLHDRRYGIGVEARLLHEYLPIAGIDSELWVYEPVDEFPYADKEYQIDIKAMLYSDLPTSLKVILMQWLTTAPFYNGTEFHRKQVLHYVQEISQSIHGNYFLILQ